MSLTRWMIAFSFLILGTGIAVYRERSRSAPARDAGIPTAPRSAASPPGRASAFELRFRALEARLGALEAAVTASPSTGAEVSPGAIPLPILSGPSAIVPDLAALEQEFRELRGLRDWESLRLLLVRVAPIGTQARPLALAILETLLEAQSAGEGAGVLAELLRFHGLASFLEWCLLNPGSSSPALRLEVASAVRGREDLDVGALMIRALAVETDAAVAEALAWNIPDRPALVKPVEAAILQHADSPFVAAALFDSMGDWNSKLKRAALHRLAEAASAGVSRRAKAELRRRSAPADGVVLLFVEGGSPWSLAGLEVGDIVAEVNGNTFSISQQIPEGQGSEPGRPDFWVAGVPRGSQVVLRVYPLAGGEVTVEAPATSSGWHGRDVRKSR